MASNVIGNTWTLTKTRVRLAMRNRTFLFFSLIMPLGFLFFFVTIFSKGDTAWTAYILGSILTMTYYASQKVVPRYNVMAVAKAGLECSVR